MKPSQRCLALAAYAAVGTLCAPLASAAATSSAASAPAVVGFRPRGPNPRAAVPLKKRLPNQAVLSFLDGSSSSSAAALAVRGGGDVASDSNVRTTAPPVVNAAKASTTDAPVVDPTKAAPVDNPRPIVSPETISSLSGALFFTIFQVLVNKIFVANGIKFPAMLACTSIIFVVMVAAEAILPGSGDKAFELLTPGANLLTKWLPVMFVPGLALLPLAPSIGSALEVAKVLSVVVVGFFFTMATVAYTVLGLRSAQGLVVEDDITAGEFATMPAAKAAAAPARPFSPETLSFLQKGTVLSAAVSIAATRTDSPLSSPLRTLFMGFATVMTYVWGARLPPGFCKVVHPLVTSTVGTLLITHLSALATGSTFTDVLRTYKSGSLSPMKTGAGDILLFLLGPAVGCLSIAMYSRKQIMAENIVVVIAAMLVSSVGGLFGTAYYARLMGIGSDMVVRLSLIPRNVTTALAIVITNILGGNIAIASSVVVLSAIFGATVGRAVLDALGIKDPVSRGLGMGAAGHGLGVASMVSEKEAFPFAAINMVLTAMCATTLVSFPAVSDALVKIATGGIEGAAASA